MPRSPKVPTPELMLAEVRALEAKLLELGPAVLLGELVTLWKWLNVAHLHLDHCQARARQTRQFAQLAEARRRRRRPIPELAEEPPPPAPLPASPRRWRAPRGPLRYQPLDGSASLARSPSISTPAVGTGPARTTPAATERSDATAKWSWPTAWCSPSSRGNDGDGP